MHNLQSTSEEIMDMNLPIYNVNSHGIFSPTLEIFFNYIDLCPQTRALNL